MSQFKPVIFFDQDGTQTFRNDIIDIEFEVEGITRTMRFQIDDNVAPQIPFRHIGVIKNPRCKEEMVYIIDPSGDSWCEHPVSRELMYLPARNMVGLLMIMGCRETDFVEKLIDSLLNT